MFLQNINSYMNLKKQGNLSGKKEYFIWSINPPCVLYIVYNIHCVQNIALIKRACFYAPLIYVSGFSSFYAPRRFLRTTEVSTHHEGFYAPITEKNLQRRAVAFTFYTSCWSILQKIFMQFSCNFHLFISCKGILSVEILNSHKIPKDDAFI